MLLTLKLVALVAATITLTVLSSCVAHELITPDLEAFANYEDMRRYIASRNQRSMRFIENPTHDTYITAYNEHHEVASRERQRRAAISQEVRKLPSEPHLVKFEISDAVEPSAEVKEFIRQHRSREESLASISGMDITNDKENTAAKATVSDEITEETKPRTTTAATTRPTRGSRAKITRSKRPKRATQSVTPNRQAFNFQVKLIPFDISEAREPDEQTKALIRRMRNLELQKLRSSTATSTVAPAVIRVYRNAPAALATQPLPALLSTFNPGKYYRPKTGKFFMKRKGKRVKRSAPQMIRFELEDAREPDTATLEQLHLARQSRLHTKSQRYNGEDKTTVVHKREARMDSKAANPVEPPVKEKVDEDETDLSSGESKRHFVYKEAPAVKTKKSIGALPVEVQKIITHLMKDHGAGGAAGGGKAYVKYIPAHMVDYRQLKSLYGAKLALPPTYSVGGAGKLSPASYIKYIQPFQKGEQLQVQIHPVPVVEKIRYIYTPVATAAVGHGYGGGGGHAALAAEEHAAAHAAATHAVKAAYAGQNVHAVAEAQAAQAAHAAKAAQAQHAIEVAHVADAYGAKGGGEGEAAGHDGGGIGHAIVVQEAGGAAHQAAPVEVHHAYAADEAQAGEEEVPVAVAIKTVHFRPSKPDPLLNENKLPEAAAGEAAGQGEQGGHGGGYGGRYGGGHGGGQVVIEQHAAAGYAGRGHANGGYVAIGHGAAVHQPVEQYKYDVAAGAQSQKAAEAPLIKIEYHGPVDAAKQNFKELPEFKELSTLVGKSTEDQIHGLTYLLAKEMQNKLKLQRKKVYIGEDHGAHTNTAPIVFPLEHQQVAEQKQQLVQVHAGAIQGRLIGMAKSKEYIPIVEQAPSGEQKAVNNAGDGGVAGHGLVQHIAIPAAKQYVAIKIEPKAPLPNSYVEYGLSPNYHGVKGGAAAEDGGGGGEGGQKTKLLVEQVIHHPTIKYQGGGAAAQVKAVVAEAELHGGGASSEQGLNYGDGLQYASKYAFGYRIRDFNTGNDFGHKQNRDLDGVTRGQYHILLPDGRIQNVIYHADDTGFHADVSFETGH